jgi:hypothetical protein
VGLGGNGLVGCIKSHSCAEMEMMSESLDASAGEASQRPSAVVAIVCVPGRQCVSFHRSPTFYDSNKRCIEPVSVSVHERISQ